MVKDVPISNLAGAVVTAWRVVDHINLLLAVRGQADEVRLKCRCERGHWIVRERPAEHPPKFLATCHNCGTRLELLLEPAVSRPA
ncbi:MAG TPA: hypothetical protein VII27_06825 [Thermoplasmata archaeon]